MPEPYIPLRVTDLVDVLLTEAGTPEYAPMPAEQHEAFRKFASLLGQRIESNYRGLLRTLLDAYAPFDPDTETLALRDPGVDGASTRLDNLFASFTLLLERGGFHRMTRDEIERTMQGASHWGIEMDVCWDVFDRVEVFYRGKGIGWRTRRPWWRFFREQELEVPTFRRVVLMLKQQSHPRLDKHADTSSVFLKVFKDIPQMDIEMLLPGTRLRMPKLERGKLGGTALGSIAFLAWKIVTSVSIPALLSGSLLALVTPLLLLGGYGYKTIFNFRMSKRTYLLQLTQSLYFQNLDSNAGVLHRLFDEAGEQDLRQTLLAWCFLWRFGGPTGWTEPVLDATIERDLERRLGVRIEVDTGEALARLERMQLVKRLGDCYIAVALNESIQKLENTEVISENSGSRWREAFRS